MGTDPARPPLALAGPQPEQQAFTEAELLRSRLDGEEARGQWPVPGNLKVRNPSADPEREPRRRVSCY